MWGPDSFTGTLPETYFEAPGSVRNVRYYDKSRMEITFPDDDPANVWYVTNGLLVVELTTGRLQLGDNLFDEREPAAVNVAGDADDPTGPTYATFGSLRFRPPLANGSAINQRVDRNGLVTDDPALAARGVTAAHRVQVPSIDHQVASPFWEFMNSSGVIWEDGYFTAPLFQDPFYATGYPISEAYWASVKVGDIYRDVLMQCFERRCLTYTPENPEGWQVEAGNVGQHYFSWRYTPVEFEGTVAFSSSRDGDPDIFTLHGGDALPTPAISDSTNDYAPDLSPDGSRIVFVRYDGEFSNIWVADSDGSNQQQVTTGMSGYEPAWSPDGQRIAFEGSLDYEPGDIWIVDADGENLTPLTDNPQSDRTPAWSPDGTRIVYAREDGSAVRLYIMEADGGNPVQLTFNGPPAIYPDWSPDGETIVYSQAGFESDIMAIDSNGGDPWLVIDAASYESEPNWSPDGMHIVYVSETFGGSDLFIVNADGSGRRNITTSPGFESSPSWSVATQ
jgi:WD40 repeat protein